jgi:hypothetical protein
MAPDIRQYSDGQQTIWSLLVLSKSTRKTLHLGSPRPLVYCVDAHGLIVISTYLAA